MNCKTNLSALASLLLCMGFGLMPAVPATAQAPTAWREGDVFVAVGNGAYQVYDRHGGLKQLLGSERSGYTTDCGFSPSGKRLYTTNYTHSKVVVYDGEHQEIVQTIDAGETSPKGHSSALVFDATGNFYVGHPDGNALIHKYNDAGILLDTYEVAVEDRGSNWIDLAADQQTLFYTSEGRRIRRYDAQQRAQLEDFAVLEGEGHAAALRLLSPGDGSGGLLVADGAQIKRLNARGDVVQVYDDKGRDSWFALNLDANGTSFWAADSATDMIYRFHIGTGQIEQQLKAGAGNSIFGVCVKGELTAGVAQAAAIVPTHFDLAQNMPNPFNPSTQINYSLPKAGSVRLVIFNLLGQEVRTLVAGERAAGLHRLNWDGTDDAGRAMGSGMYIYRLTGEGFVQTRRMMLLK
jgi:hypothetical protein